MGARAPAALTMVPPMRLNSRPNRGFSAKLPVSLPSFSILGQEAAPTWHPGPEIDPRVELDVRTGSFPERISRAFVVRLVGYLFVIGMVFEASVLLVTRLGGVALYEEGGLVEWGQFLALAAIGTGFLTLARRYPASRGVYALLAVAALFTIERELNYFPALRESWCLILKHTAQIALIGGVCFWQRQSIVAQFDAFTRRPTFLMLILGFLLVTVWAQVLGQGVAWRSLYADPILGKRYLEEQLELGGYLLILFGLVEEIWHLRLPAGLATEGNRGTLVMSDSSRQAVEPVHRRAA